MAEFLVEVYVSRSDDGVAQRGAERARLAADALQRNGTPVRYVRSIYVPEEETCFLLFEGPSPAAIQEALRHSALPAERVARVASWREHQNVIEGEPTT